jgi:hypothetical protein
MRVSLVNVLVISATLIVVFMVSLVAMRVARWRRDVALRRHAAPVLVMPLSGSAVTPQRPHVSREVFPVRSSPASVRSVARDQEEVAVADETEPDVIVIDDRAAAHRATQPLSSVTAHPGDDTPATAGPGWRVEGSQVRVVQPEDGTLEFLPGRLEIVGGEDVGQEIHFARKVGERDATITFGRSEGPPLRHVQLLDPTVSRAHAKMTFSGERWHLRNLSQTNPVILNGSPLPDHGAGITLEEGDRLEMGAVVFVFHAR